MKVLILLITSIISINLFGQEMKIFNLLGEEIKCFIFDYADTKKQIVNFNGVQDEALRKELTARTYRLSNDEILIEFYDRQSIKVKDEEEFKKLKDIRFVKNNLEFLKKNISYEIELDYNDAIKLGKEKTTKSLAKYSGSFGLGKKVKVFELASNQILFIEKSSDSKSATIYRDIKTLASENSEIQEIEYGFEDDEYYMKELAKGNSFSDFEPNDHYIYTSYLDDVIRNHKLRKKEEGIITKMFLSNLYQSDFGYWVLIDEVNQPNQFGNKLPILNLMIFEDLNVVRKAQKTYENFLKQGVEVRYPYQDISDEYGKDFPLYVDSLIKELPSVLNIDKTQLIINEYGVSILDEAIKWNHHNFSLFKDWIPAVVAFYGEFYMATHKLGKWESILNKEINIWIPQITLADGSSAFNMRDFYISLMEYPFPIKEAGDFDGKVKALIKNGN